MKKYQLIIPIVFLTLNTTYAADDDSNYFNSISDTKLFYEIGGNSSTEPLYRPSSNIELGLGNVNIGYSCGEFDISASFSNLMNNFKDGIDNAVNAVTQSANAAITSLPALVLQRTQPGLYNMFQEYKVSAETDIDIAAQSCEEMEAEIARGGNPHAKFLQQAKSAVWKDEVINGDIIKAKEKAEDNPEEKGIISYGGQDAGGIGQPPIKIISGAVKAGYNSILNQDNATANNQAPTDSKLGKQFTSAGAAADWTTDVIGDYEINNTQEISKIGTGLSPKIEEEKEQLVDAVNTGELEKIGINNTVINKLNTLNANQQQALLSNIIINKAIENTVEKALTARRLLLVGSQDPDSTINHEERTKRIAQLEEEIRVVMFEHDIRQKLGNKTILNLLNKQTIHANPNQTPKSSFKNENIKKFF